MGYKEAKVVKEKLIFLNNETTFINPSKLLPAIQKEKIKNVEMKYQN